MISVLIIGNGNVATHLTTAFLKSDTVSVTQINSRNLKDIPPAEVTIIAVSDDAIAEVSSKINNGFVVHTSGSVSMHDLQNTTTKGVFYMLQTFTKEKKVTFSKIPFCLEVEDPKNYTLLEKVAKSIGKKVYSINSEQRKILHVAAVFVNNFTNHLYKIANDICQNNNVSFEILQPLIEETAKKIQMVSPANAQTGPAIRKDLKTIKKHLQLLNGDSKKIYKTLTKSILNEH